MRRNIPLMALLLCGALACGQVVDLHSLTHVRTLGPGGGTVSLDGFEVAIPEGALGKNVTFVLSHPEAPPEGAAGPIYQVAPEGVEFSTAVSLRLDVDLDALPEGVEAGQLALSWHDGTTWIPLETSTWDPEAERLTGLTDHLSLWAAVCVPACPTEACEGPDGCGGACPACPTMKLDVLWVVDNSASMCQEQRGLVEHLQDFVGALPTEAHASLNMAVITTDAISGKGVFSEVTAEKFPNACAETVIQACATNLECQDGLGAGWGCNPPPSTGGELLTENLNGSLNSSCVYTCASDDECCDLFCADASCGECTHQCVAPGGGADVDMNCVPQPFACEDQAPGDWEAWGRCHLQVGADQSFSANLESGIKGAWLALDPDGPNATQSAGFLRPDAHLLIVFMSDEDDCSIHENFCSPSYTCEDDGDCPGDSPCVDGLCCGVIKKDNYNICGLLGEYKGEAHHQCAYDLGCDDCETDDDCEPNWTCEEGKKCRPAVFGFNTIASFQNPPGTPIFALAGASDYQNRFQSLKGEPLAVMVASINGDAVVSGDDAASLISEECLAEPTLERCQDYQATKLAPEIDPACDADPTAAGCEELLLAKQECARQCYVASKGDNTNPQAKNSYVCSWAGGTADWGGRYARMAYMFGVNGLRLNLCDPDGFGTVMQELGEFVTGVME
ncbi:MAG: hypothetical protein ABIK09_13075 [Pseudomonadota bacterium]